MTDEGMEQYLSAFKHGMPPHGGLGIGMERLTMKMMNEDNVKRNNIIPKRLKSSGTIRRKYKKRVNPPWIERKNCWM